MLPTDADLSVALALNAAKYRVKPSLGLSQVFAIMACFMTPRRLFETIFPFPMTRSYVLQCFFFSHDNLYHPIKTHTCIIQNQ